MRDALASAPTQNVAATRSAAGTWGTAVALSTVPAGRLDVAIDGAGDAIAVFGPTHLVGSTIINSVYFSKRPAGGTWSAATILSAPVTQPAAPAPPPMPLGPS